MTDFKNTLYEDADLKQILDEIEQFGAEKVSIRAEAAGKCGGLAKRIKNRKADAKGLGIPLAILNGLLKQRKLERQIEAVSAGISEELTEIWEEASGQFSMLSPVEDEPEEEPPAKRAASRAKKAAQAQQQAELEEGAKVLEEVTGVKH